MKNPGKILFLCLVILAISCFKPVPRIYNEGTAYKMPHNPKTSDFYRDIEILLQYEGRVQDYLVKLKSFLWVNEDNPNYKIESAFYFIKRFPGVDPKRYQYGLHFRRYITVENEAADSSIIKKITANKDSFSNGFCTLLLGGNDDSAGDFTYDTFATVQRWPASNGNFENYALSLSYKLKNGSFDDGEYIFNYILEKTAKFEMHFQAGHFVELDNHIVVLTDEEFEVFRQGLHELIKQEKQTVEEYIEYVRHQDLR